jgi:serine/threonine-protein kinase RsbW
MRWSTDKAIQPREAMWLDQQRGILIVVRDPGPGFDPGTIPNPCVGENVYSNHGRGIFLINQLMDEVKFARNGTEIHMVKR